jgi:DNA-binding IclR family transcriptional regulator
VRCGAVAKKRAIDIELATDRQAYLPGDGVTAFVRLVPHTITDASALETELRKVRSQGWASTAEELELGLNAIAAPVRNAAGEVVAAVGVSGLRSRARGSHPG